MKLLLSLAIIALTPLLGSAQTTIFSEEFETAGVQSMSPGWVWIGDAPTFEVGCNGNWGLRKETPIHTEQNSTNQVEHWLFHPIPYDSLLLYRLNVTMLVEDPDQNGPDTHDEPFAYAALAWMDLTPGATNGSVIGDIYSSDGYCVPSLSSIYYKFNDSPVPGRQFGVVLASTSPFLTMAPMWVQWDNVVVDVRPGNAQFVGSMLLGGAYDPVTHMMKDDLRQQGLVPLTEPYTALGWPQVAGGGGETTTAAVLNATYNGFHVVDWVRLELRKWDDPSVVRATRQALVLQNGSVISAQGSVSVLFGVLPGVFCVAVRHRNHLGAMLPTHTQVVYPGGGIWTYNFTGTQSTSVYGTDGLKVTDGKGMLWEGDVNGDHTLRYTGNDNDPAPILNAIGGVVFTNTVTGYRNEDVNMDGVVKYTGAGNDRDRLLLNIGPVQPTDTRVEQVP